ncbi:MAG TPA: alkaline phosphatase family protein [Candidatus Gallacutalibacter stercoravium]|nr:alkaline phosphatase family protein [Candidatus Gallacutalibacter stercoravium]
MAKHLIVMSVDAMVFEDLAYLSALPHFGILLEQGSRIERVRSIYPTLTHPIHVTLMTGCYPDRTGVCNNVRPEIGNPNASWYNDLGDVGVQTIFHAAKTAGLSTCACRWPVTSRAAGVIDYLVPEILEETPGEDPAAPYHRQGTSAQLMDDIVGPLLHVQNPSAPRHPAYDTFEIDCAASIIKRYKPNLVFTHPGQVDSARHDYGLFNIQVDQSLALADRYLGRLMDAARDAGIYDETNFVVLSDHGHLEVKRTICPNVVLADEGLIRLDGQGNVTSWDAYIQSAGLSAQVFVRDPGDANLCARVHGLLRHMCNEGIYGISQVFTAAEAENRYRLAGGFSFVLEGDGFSSFGESCVRPIARPLEITDYRYGHSTHGHLPEKGPQPPFLCIGPDFRPGVVLHQGRIIDEAPTMAAAMGLSLPEADGEPVQELLY